MTAFSTDVKLDWGTAGPGMPLASSWFVARFTFHMSVATQVGRAWETYLAAGRMGVHGVGEGIVGMGNG